MIDFLNDDCLYFRWKYDVNVFDPNTYLDDLWLVLEPFRGNPAVILTAAQISDSVMELSAHARDKNVRTVARNVVRLTYALGFIDKTNGDPTKVGMSSSFKLTNNGRAYLLATEGENVKYGRDRMLLLRQFLLLCRPFQTLVRQFWPYSETTPLSGKPDELAEMLGRGRWNRATASSFRSGTVVQPELGSIIIVESNKLYLPESSRQRIRDVWTEIVKYEIARNLMLSQKFGLVPISEIEQFLGKAILLPRNELAPLLHRLAPRPLTLTIHMGHITAVTMNEVDARKLFQKIQSQFEVVT
jgi:hypothetical protein